MRHIDTERSNYNLFVAWASAIAIFLVAVVAIAGNADDPQRALAIFVGFSLPFLVALASVVTPVDPGYRRWVWLVCALGALIPSYFFIWNGMGLFLFVISLTYVWAFWGSRNLTRC